LRQHFPFIEFGTYDGSCAAALVEQVPVIASKAMQSPEPGRLLLFLLAVERVMSEPCSASDSFAVNPAFFCHTASNQNQGRAAPDLGRQGFRQLQT
jgi:hypothetical protein